MLVFGTQEPLASEKHFIRPGFGPRQLFHVKVFDAAELVEGGSAHGCSFDAHSGLIYGRIETVFTRGNRLLSVRGNHPRNSSKRTNEEILTANDASD